MQKVKNNTLFLFLSNGEEEMVRNECKKQKVDYKFIKFMTVEREMVPKYISISDLSVFFIRGDYTKAGCSPIKLAETLACGVPVVTNTGIGDLDKTLNYSENYSKILPDFSIQSFLSFANRFRPANSAEQKQIRQNGSQFDLPLGLEKYGDVYKNLLEKGGSNS